MRWPFTVALIVLVGSVVLGCLGFLVPLDIGAQLVVGWALFLWRVVPQLTINGGGVLTAVVCLAALAAGLHGFLRWFFRQIQGPGGEGGGPRWHCRWTASLLGMVVLLFVAGIAAVGISHQTGWLLTAPEPLSGSSFREAVAASQSRNNLKQISFGCVGYEEQRQHFPPGGTFDAQGRAYHGWQTLLLPHIDQEALYRRVHLDRPWDHPDNAGVFWTVVHTYQSPWGAEVKNAEGLALSHYAGNVHVLGGDVPVTLKAIGAARGLSNTLLVGEAAGNYKPWGCPTNWRDPARGINRTPDGFGSPSPRGTNFALADGSVRWFTSDTDPEFLEMLSLPEPPHPRPPVAPR
jgi:hypothetical protein